MPNWEDTFVSWSQGPGKTEQEKCENAERQVREALRGHARLNALNISVFAQGSYANRTNVRQDSDVDICIRINTTFFYTIPTGTSNADFGITAPELSFAEFKNLVGEALVKYFGEKSVTRGNKAFDIHANTYRVDADVLAAFQFREFYVASDGRKLHRDGISFVPDSGGPYITNYPEQNLENGREKHDATARRYKKIIRILKNLRNKMQDEKIPAATGVASCLIEHLVFTVPNPQFNTATLTQDVRNVLAYVFNNTMSDEDTCKDWTEVNGIKFLFRPQQPWTRKQAHDFISAAWDYLGFQ